MKDQPYTEKITPRYLIYYFLIAFGITWGLSVFATKNLLPFTIPPIIMSICGILLHYGPAFAAIIMVAIAGGGAGILGLFKKLGVWRVGIGWYLFVFLYPVALRLSAVGINVLLGGEAPEFFSSASVPRGNPLVLLPVVFVLVLLQAGLAEEIGWRGYALPGLQNRYGALVSSIILAAIWGLWHFHPLNFAKIWPVAGGFFLNILAFTILITWVYNNTKGSILLVVLFHTASNVSDWIVPTSPAVANASGIGAYTIQIVLGIAVALLITLIYGPKHLSRKANPPG